MKRVGKFLTDNFLEALDGLELITKNILLMPTVPPTIPSYEKLSERLIEEWDGGTIRKAIYHLIHSGVLKRTGKNKYFLTAKGVGRLLEIRIRKKIQEGRKTKQKYLVLIFDIPEEQRDRRDLFRRRLKELGFEKIQQSVWITQYDILREVKVLIKIFDLDDYVKFFIAEKV